MVKSSTSILSGMVKRMKSAANEPLRDLIDEYLLLRKRANHRLDLHQISMVPRPRPPGRFSPSSVCGCSRASVFKFTGVRGKDKSDPEMELIFENGDWFHHKWQALFYDMQLVLGRDRFRVAGRVGCGGACAGCTL